MNTTTHKKRPAKVARRAAIYARVSTFDKGQNAETQLAPLRGYAKSRGFALRHELVDYASGSKDDRTNYQSKYSAYPSQDKSTCKRLAEAPIEGGNP
jgi:predicted site-specific integrase-resolvase